MTAENYLASIVNRLTSQGSQLVPQGYFRSKLFIAPYSSNVLVSASGPIFSLLERLCLSPSLPPISEIRDNIEHEINAFHSKLDASNYPSDLIKLARYLLSATIDELLGKNYLRVYQTACEFKAFTPLTSDGVDPQQRFFDILNFVKDKPNQYLDLIELIYFCLIAGFEGAYHMKADGRQVLEDHIEELYQIVQQNRYNKSHKLFNENPIPKSTKTSYKTSAIAALVAIGLVVFAFFTSQIVLEHKAKTVLFGHTQLAMLEH